MPPEKVLEKVNNQLCENNDAEMFVTVWIGIMEISTGKMVCANAGHEYPAVRRAGGEYELLRDKHGFVLAGMEGARYRGYELTLHPGDCIFVYTDGVPEATDASIQVEAAGEPLQVTITFSDGGIPYNPLSRAEPDITLSAEERGIGGLAIPTAAAK